MTMLITFMTTNIKNIMKLNEIMISVSSWNQDNQSKYFDRVTQNVPIGIRMIFHRKELSDSQKLEGIKWINEFLHEMNKSKNFSKNILGTEKDAISMADYIKYIANKHGGLLRSEIAFCIEDAYKWMKHKTK